MTRARKAEGVLLDVDGTLIDSNDAHARSWQQALAEFGVEVPLERIQPLIGMGGDKLLPRLVGVDAESETGEAISKRRAAIFRQQFVPHLRPTPGAHELVERLRAERLRLVIATSAKREELEVMLAQVGLDDLIERKTSASDAEHSKPDPDIIRAALDKAKLTADTAILLGDTPYDVQAGGRAQVPTVALRCGGWPAEALKGAIAIYDHPAHLLSEFTSSPFCCAE